MNFWRKKDTSSLNYNSHFEQVKKQGKEFQMEIGLSIKIKRLKIELSVVLNFQQIEEYQMKGSHKTQKDNVESQTFTKHHFQNGRSQNTAVDNSELLKIKDY